MQVANILTKPLLIDFFIASSKDMNPEKSTSIECGWPDF
jgi:hypothetical protein